MDLTNVMFLYVFSEFGWYSKSVTWADKAIAKFTWARDLYDHDTSLKGYSQLGVFKVFVNHDTSTKTKN